MLDFNNIAKLGGWLTKAEGTFLYKAAKEVNPKNVIVEIGSWKGKSTVCLGKGVHENSQVTIYAIDPHIGSSKHQKMFNNSVDTYKEFIENIKRAAVNQYIEPIQKTSEEASKNFHKPIEFLFIDGAHEFELANLDYKLWFPKVIDQGLISFHDTWHLLGPHLVTARILLFSSEIKNPKLIDTITCFTKVKKNTFFDRTYNRAFFFYRLIFGFFGYLQLAYKGTKLK